MSFFPIFIDWQGIPCLVAGGGSVALHKAELLCAQGAKVTVVAPEIREEFASLPVSIRRRTVTAEDTEGQLLVVDATGDPAAEALLSLVCRVRGILFTSSCRNGGGNVTFPAVYRQGKTAVAVSTSGASPAACARLRDELAAHIPEEMDRILDAMAQLRPLSRKWFDDQPVRRRFLHKCLDTMLKEKRPLTPEEVEALRQAIQINEEISEEEKP